jgi:hypothetical protein
LLFVRDDDFLCGKIIFMRVLGEARLCSLSSRAPARHRLRLESRAWTRRK